MSYMFVLAYNGYQRQRYTLYRHRCAMTFFSQVYQKVHCEESRPEKVVFEGDAETITTYRSHQL